MITQHPPDRIRRMLHLARAKRAADYPLGRKRAWTLHTSVNQRSSLNVFAYFIPQVIDHLIIKGQSEMDKIPEKDVSYIYISIRHWPE